MIKEQCFFEYPDFENIKQMICYVTKEYSDNRAFILKDTVEKDVSYKNITFKDFFEDINNLGTALYNLGLKDKKIAIISKNRYEWILSYTTILLGNMVAIPLDKGLTEIEIINSVERTAPDAIIFDSAHKEVIEKLKNSSKINQYISMESEEGELSIQELIKFGKASRKTNSEFENVQIDNDKTSVLCFTSGTSSKSKIVELSHRNIASNIVSLNRSEDFRETDVNLAFLPFHHMFGSTGALFVLSFGGATAFPDGLRYIAQNLKEYKVSVFIGVPLLIESMHKKIMKEIEKQKKTKLIKVAKKVTNVVPFLKRKIFKPIIDQLGGNLRLIINGAAAIDPDVWKSFNEMGIKVLQGYGLTETSPVVAAENFKHSKKGSIGLPMPGVKVKIFDKNELGIGELAVKGPNVMKGYYQNEEANKAVFRDGWFLTGDLAYIDKSGYIFITGRKKNVIVLKNGKNIYPEELENLVNKIPLVKESMVFGLPKNDDMLVSVKIQYDDEYAKEKYPNENEKGLEKIIWEKIKEINQTMPTYKYIKNLVVTKEEFIKTTTAKIKRFEEIKKIEQLAN